MGALSRAIALVLATTAGCGGAQGPASRADVLVSLERRECLDACPVYALIVYQDGAVQYDGGRYVAVTGRRTDRIEPAALSALRRAFEDAGFAQMSDFRTPECTDQPIEVLTYEGHRVVHDLGDEDAPEALAMLAATVDHVTDSRRWVGIPQTISIGCP